MSELVELSRIVDGQPVVYSVDQLRRDFPRQIFPRELTQRDLPATVFIVLSAPRPMNAFGSTLVYDGKSVIRVWFVLSDEDVRAELIARVRAHARAHIQADATGLIEQLVSIALGEGDPSELAWVKRVRTMCNEAEAALLTMTREELDAWQPPAWERTQ